MLRWLWRFLVCKQSKPRIVFVVRNVRETAAVVVKTPQHFGWPLLGDILMSLQLSSSQEATLSIAPLDKKGNPASVDGTPIWLTDNTQVLALTPSDDGLSCKVAAVGPLGSALVSVTADADMGEGVKAIVGTLSVNVNAGEAITIAIQPGPVTEQPE